MGKPLQNHPRRKRASYPSHLRAGESCAPPPHTSFPQTEMRPYLVAESPVTPGSLKKLVWLLWKTGKGEAPFASCYLPHSNRALRKKGGFNHAQRWAHWPRTKPQLGKPVPFHTLHFPASHFPLATLSGSDPLTYSDSQAQHPCNGVSPILIPK